jgi:hypothetical protein
MIVFRQFWLAFRLSSTEKMIISLRCIPYCKEHSVDVKYSLTIFHHPTRVNFGVKMHPQFNTDAIISYLKERDSIDRYIADQHLLSAFSLYFCMAISH